MCFSRTTFLTDTRYASPFERLRLLYEFEYCDFIDYNFFESVFFFSRVKYEKYNIVFTSIFTDQSKVLIVTTHIIFEANTII